MVSSKPNSCTMWLATLQPPIQTTSSIMLPQNIVIELYVYPLTTINVIQWSSFGHRLTATCQKEIRSKGRSENTCPWVAQQHHGRQMEEYCEDNIKPARRWWTERCGDWLLHRFFQSLSHLMSSHHNSAILFFAIFFLMFLILHHHMLFCLVWDKGIGLQGTPL